jgi:putative spermidine/putrescine transport system substrate-binding protein
MLIRSHMIRTSATALVLATLCASAGAQEKPVAGEVKEGSLAGKTLTFVSFGGIFQEGQMASLEDFVKKSGVTLLQDGPTEVAKVQAQVEAGNVTWDVVDTGDLPPFVHCGTLFQKLDFSKIDISNIPEGQVGECSVPAMNYGVVLMYKNDTYKDNPPQSWQDFFDTEKFPGVRAIDGSGEPTGGFLEQALIASGGSVEADMIMMWSGRAMTAVKNGAQFTPVWQDWLVVMDQLTIPVGVKDPDAAHALINYAIGKQAQEIMAEKTSYSPIHKDAQPDVEPAVAAFMTNTPERQKQGYQQNVKFWVENHPVAAEKWTAVMAGN